MFVFRYAFCANIYRQAGYEAVKVDWDPEFRADKELYVLQLKY